MKLVHLELRMYIAAGSSSSTSSFLVCSSLCLGHADMVVGTLPLLWELEDGYARCDWLLQLLG
jgi:hypothetical protein